MFSHQLEHRVHSFSLSLPSPSSLFLPSPTSLHPPTELDPWYPRDDYGQIRISLFAIETLHRDGCNPRPPPGTQLTRTTTNYPRHHTCHDNCSLGPVGPAMPHPPPWARSSASSYLLTWTRPAPTILWSRRTLRKALKSDMPKITHMCVRENAEHVLRWFDQIIVEHVLRGQTKSTAFRTLTGRRVDEEQTAAQRGAAAQRTAATGTAHTCRNRGVFWKGNA